MYNMIFFIYIKLDIKEKNKIDVYVFILKVVKGLKLMLIFYRLSFKLVMK